VLTTAGSQLAYQQAIQQGHGLLFMPSYYTWGQGVTDTPDWEGLFTVGGGTDATNPTLIRSLYLGAFADGYVTQETRATSWLRMNGESPPEVEFDTEFWHGGVTPGDCGEWQDSSSYPTWPTDSGTYGTTDTYYTTWTWDTGTPHFDPHRDLGVAWDWVGAGGKVSIVLANSDAASVSLGMAETAALSSGWYGEDCQTGGGCHVLGGGGGDLAYVETPGEVVLGSTTIFDGLTAFDNDGQDRLTYYLRLAGGSLDGACFVWGDSPQYYDVQGCEVL
jgi:hypothetical protein